MEHDEIKAVLDRVLNWPHERQEQAAWLLREIEQQEEAQLEPTEQQVAEIRRRLADAHPSAISLDQVRRRFARSSA